MAFGNTTVLCVPSVGALGLSSPDWGWAEWRCIGAEPLGPWVTQEAAEKELALENCPSVGPFCVPPSVQHQQGLVRAFC